MMLMKEKTIPILVFPLVFFGAIISFLSPIKGMVFYLLIAVAIWVYVKPLLGFYLVFLMSPLENVGFLYNSPLRTIPERYPAIIFPVILTVAVLLLRKAVEGNPKDSRPFSNTMVLLLLIFGWAVISYLWTIDTYHGINAIYNLGLGLAVYFLTLSFIKDKETLEKMFKILAFWGFILAITLFLSNKVDIKNDQLFSTELSKDLIFRINIATNERRPGGFTMPQRASNVLGFFFFMGIALYPKVRRHIKILLFLLGLFFIMDILSTNSKGGIGAFLLGMLSFIFFYPGVRKKAISLTSLFLFCVVSIFIFNLIVFHSDRLISSAEQSELSLSYRLGFWKEGFDMMSNRWIGAGAGGFDSIVDPWPGAHSFYFSILFDLGIIGFAMFLIFITYILYRLRKSIINTVDEDMKLYLYCMVGALMVFLVHGLVEMDYQMPYFWMLIGTVMAVINISDKRQQLTMIHEGQGI